MKLNQFAVYRVDQQTAGKALWHLPYQEARQQNVSITVENYRLISIHEMQENEKVADIWKRTKNQCEVSDVLVLNKNGEISCYYVDENYPQYLAGFIRINTSGALITMETENYQIDGKKGNWIATDTVIIDGKQFYLMEHQVYRDQAQGVILDAYGKMVVEECKKFDEKTKQKIHDYIQQQVPLNPVEQLKQDGKIRLEHYQKFYQNGTYERSRESGTEANYDMVDGLVNNQKKNLEKISDARNNKQTSRNQQNNKPKKRRSVIKRLHQKQIAIARRSGKPIEDGSQLLTRDRLLHAEFRLAYAACNAVLPCPNDCVVSVICFRNVCERDARVRDSRGTGAPVQNQNQIAARHAAAPVEG